MLARTNKRTRKTEIFNIAKNALIQYRLDFDILTERTAKSQLFDLLMGEFLYMQNGRVAWHKAKTRPPLKSV